jgi:glutathione S-transferase
MCSEVYRKLALPKNRSKPLWINDTIGELMERLREEVEELQTAIDARLAGPDPVKARAEYRAKVRAEAADVAAFCAFIIDVHSYPGEDLPVSDEVRALLQERDRWAARVKALEARIARATTTLSGRDS